MIEFILNFLTTTIPPGPICFESGCTVDWVVGICYSAGHWVPCAQFIVGN